MPDPDLHDKIKQYVIGRIKALAIIGIGNNVYDFMDTDKTNIVMPSVLVSIGDEMEEPLYGDTQTTDRYYPINVLLTDRISPHSHAMGATVLARRKRIFDAFHQHRLGSSLPVSVVYVVPKPIFDEELNEFQMIVSGLLLKVWASETRTVAIG